MTVRMLTGDCRDVLRTQPPEAGRTKNWRNGACLVFYVGS
jgi:hypothetical protein